ncbi:MAG: hypothetical protein ACE5EV_04145, partial [Gaiellales bacterium]
MGRSQPGHTSITFDTGTGAARLTTLVSRVNGLFDANVIDGMVNGMAAGTIGAGTRFRRREVPQENPARP